MTGRGLGCRQKQRFNVTAALPALVRRVAGDLLSGSIRVAVYRVWTNLYDMSCLDPVGKRGRVVERAQRNSGVNPQMYYVGRA